MDADSQARLVFDRLDDDFSKMTKRADVDYIFSKYPAVVAGPGTPGANDKIFFYSEAPAYASGTVTGANRSSVALVGYRIETSGSTPYQLERLGKDLTWDGNSSGATVPGGMAFLTFATSSTTPLAASTIAFNWSSTMGSPTDNPPYSPPSGSDPSYHVLADSVFRMEICFQVKNLTNSAAPSVTYFELPGGLLWRRFRKPKHQIKHSSRKPQGRRSLV